MSDQGKATGSQTGEIVTPASETGAAFKGDFGVASGHVFSLKNVGPQSITICGPHAPLATIRPDGTLEYGPDYTPDEAARIFWEALGYERTQVKPKGT